MPHAATVQTTVLQRQKMGKPKITWLNILHHASPPTDTIVNLIEEKTDTELTFNWIPDASKEERLNNCIGF